MATVIGGELREWHKVTLDFMGPQTSEDTAENPFTYYRLDVTFRNNATGETLTVPGFWAADGNAGETNATAGNVWRVHFAPPDTGTWTYTASFRTGHSVAASTNPGAGTSAGYFDGTTGSFAIAPTDKSGADFRGKGLLEYVSDNHYRFAGTDEWFLKGGIDSPENLLAYSDFDNTVGTHTYSPHVKDWHAGDPIWDGGKGKGLIGAINYLSDQGINSTYFLTMNIQGDGNDVSPWTSPAAHTRYDVSKLDQWGVAFDYMTQKGIMLHVVTQEQENDQLLDGGELGVERSVYYRELIARFGYNLGLQWNLGEENSNTDAQRKAFADYIKAVDPYDHPIVIHSFPNSQDGTYGPLMGDKEIDGASLQTSTAHEQTIRWLDRSNAAGHPWVVSLDEVVLKTASGADDHITGVAPDIKDPNHDVIRKEFLWANLMAGGSGAEWYFGYYPGDGDITGDNFRTRENMWEQTKVALDFFRTYLPFEGMSHADTLTPAVDYVLAEPGQVYAIYLPNGGTTTLNLFGQTGTYEVKWYDPREGGALLDGIVRSVVGGGSVALGSAPRDTGEDWAVLVRRINDQPPAGITVTQTVGAMAVAEGGASDTVSVALTSQPTANVSITVNGTADVSASPGTLTFTSANWNVAQSVTVAAVNDTLVEGPETASLSFATSSSDTRYNGLSVTPVSVAITDNDQSTVGRYWIADAGTDQKIVEIHNGTTFDDIIFAGTSITIVGEGPGESFKFNFDNGTVTRTENVAPYALMGDQNGDLFGGLTLSPGSHTLVTDIYSSDNGTGTNLGHDMLSFYIV
jgi:hypothetical protein